MRSAVWVWVAFVGATPVENMLDLVARAGRSAAELRGGDASSMDSAKLERLGTRVANGLANTARGPTWSPPGGLGVAQGMMALAPLPAGDTKETDRGAMCEQDFQSHCPSGWMEQGPRCMAPWTYGGSCETIFFRNMNAAMKSDWGRRCEVAWPCLR
mmetsp:Transcript_81101/g.216635  ORF Transcript_81101/g.216635 Transcript_81101/m.216635 type:complete len:157 (-) Transcript_81101:63-533(-)